MLKFLIALSFTVYVAQSAATVKLPLMCSSECTSQEAQSAALSSLSTYFSVPSGATGVSATLLETTIDGYGYLFSFGFASQYTSYLNQVLPNANQIFPADGSILVDQGYFPDTDRVATLDFDEAPPSLLYVFDLGGDADQGVICSPDFTQYDALSLCRTTSGLSYDLKDVSFVRKQSSQSLPVRLTTSPGCTAQTLLASDCPGMKSLLPVAGASTSCPSGPIHLMCQINDVTVVPPQTILTQTPNPATQKVVLSNYSHRSGAVTLNDGVYQGAVCMGKFTGDGFAAQTLCSMAGLDTASSLIYGATAATPAPAYTIGSLTCDSLQTSVTDCSKTTVSTCGTGLQANIYCPELIEGGTTRTTVTLFTLQGAAVETLSGVLSFFARSYSAQVVITDTASNSVSFYNNNPAQNKFGPSGADLDFMWSSMSTDYIRLVLGGSGAITRSSVTYIPTTPTTIPSFPSGIPTQPPSDNTPVPQDTTGWTYRLIPFYANNPRKGFFEIKPRSSSPEYMCTPISSSSSSNIALSQELASILCNTVGYSYANAKAFTAPMMLPVVGLSDGILPTITSLTCPNSTLLMNNCDFYRNSSMGSIRCGGDMKIALQCGPDVAVEMTAITSKSVPYDEAAFKDIVSDQAIVSPNRIQMLGITQEDSNYAYRRFTITDPSYVYENPNTNFPSFSFPSGSYPSGGFSFSFPTSNAGNILEPQPAEPAESVELPKSRAFEAEAVMYNQTGSGYDMTVSFIRSGSFEALSLVGIHELRSNLSRYTSATTPSGFGLTLEGTYFGSISSNVFGRVVVRVDGNPTGVADGTGISDATALNLCQQMGVQTSYARVIPHVAPPNLTTPIYIRDVLCTSLSAPCSYLFSSPLLKSGQSTHITDAGLLCSRNVLPQAAFAAATDVLRVLTNGTLAANAIIPCMSRLLNVPAGRMGLVATAGFVFNIEITESATESSAQDVYVVAMLTSSWASYAMCGIISIERAQRPTTTIATTQVTGQPAASTTRPTTAVGPTVTSSSVPGTTTGGATAISTTTAQSPSGSTQPPTSGQTAAASTTQVMTSTSQGATSATSIVSTSSPTSISSPPATTATGQTATTTNKASTTSTTRTATTTTTRTTTATTTARPSTVIEFTTNATINITAVKEALARETGANISDIDAISCPSGGQEKVCFAFKDSGAATKAETAANNGQLQNVGIVGAAAASNDTTSPSSSDSDNKNTIIIIVVVVVVVVVIVIAITAFMCKKARANKGDEPDANENFVQLLELENAEEGEGNRYAI